MSIDAVNKWLDPLLLRSRKFAAICAAHRDIEVRSLYIVNT